MTLIDNPTVDRVLELLETVGPDAIFGGTNKNYRYSARVDLWLIRQAWESGADLEGLADGFGKGMGTMGDWSAIRDSSADAKVEMLEVAVEYLKGTKH